MCACTLRPYRNGSGNARTRTHTRVNTDVLVHSHARAAAPTHAPTLSDSGETFRSVGWCGGSPLPVLNL